MPRILLPAEELIEYKEFVRANPGMTLEEYAWMQLSPDLFLGVAEILSPEFKYYQGGIFFANSFDETRFNEWHLQLSRDMLQIEKMLNHTHVRGVIQFRPQDGIALVRVVAKILQKFWSYSLYEQFPDADVTIEVVDDIEEKYCTITIYQSAHG